MCNCPICERRCEVQTQGCETLEKEMDRVCQMYPMEPAVLIRKLHYRLEHAEKTLTNLRASLSWYSKLLPIKAFEKLETMINEELVRMKQC